MTTTTPPQEKQIRSYGHLSFDSRINALTALSHKIRELYQCRNNHLTGWYFRARTREFIAAKRELENNFQWRLEQ